jgi:hypothetical protein
MIDKELIRQAAEDIDIFEADLSQEYDRIAYQRKSIRLWPWAAVAACLVAVVGVSLPMLIGTNDEAPNTIITEARSETENKLVAQVSESDNNTAIAPSPTPAVTETTHSRLPQKVRTVLPAATSVRTEPQINQESTEANELEMMCELLDEVTLQTVAEEKYEEHLYYTLMEEICTNASNEPNLPELSL